MFGAIDVSSTANRQLQEKAGREGFRENRAYREFREILKNFLVQLAANFFSSEGDSSSSWRDERARLKGASPANAKREAAASRQRQQFSTQIDDRLSRIESGRLVDELDAVVAFAVADLQSAFTVAEMEQVESAARTSLRSIRAQVALERPARLALTAEIERGWRALQKFREVVDAAFERAVAELQEAITAAAAALPESPEANATPSELDRSVALASTSRGHLEALQGDVTDLLASTTLEIAGAASQAVSDFDNAVEAILGKRAAWTFTDEIEVTGEISLEADRQRAVLQGLLDRLASCADGEDSPLIDVVNLQERILDLTEQLDSNIELLQLGQAVQVVSHEFEASIRSIRAGLKTLDPWAKSTPRLRPVVRDLRASFAHLDAYLRLFTPLQRRLYGEAVAVTGEEIAAFVGGVFSERLARHQVELEVTETFRDWNLVGYPSTFYPAFTNLVDNAIYWVSNHHHGSDPKVITLDADETALFVRDNGPGVRPRDREAVFMRGFGRRRGGRGLGLSLARELLERDGWSLDLIDSNIGATFRLRPSDTERGPE